MIKVALYHIKGVAVVRPKGTLDLSTYPALRDALLKYAAEEPTAIVVQLGPELEVVTPSVLSVFSLVWLKVSEWPGVPMLLVAENSTQRRAVLSSGVLRFVPCHTTLAAAVQASREPVQRRRDQLMLPITPYAPRAAREFVRTTCERWGLRAIQNDAVLVASELADNGVRYARTAANLQLELRPGALAIAVSDDDPALPRVRKPGDGRAGGRGLIIVDTLSRSWGTTPTPSGGKVVWAVLALHRE